VVPGPGIAIPGLAAPHENQPKKLVSSPYSMRRSFMRRMLLPSLGVCVCLILAAGVVRAQEDDPRALINKAIKAQGGEKALAKYKAAQLKTKGTVHRMGGLAFTSEDYLQKPDKIKQVVQVTIMGKDYTQTIVFDGKKVWFKFNDDLKDLGDKALELFKEMAYAEEVSNLIVLKDKKYKLSPLGEVKVEGRDAVGVQVSAKGHKDVNLYFDKAKHMLLKSETRTLDFETEQEITQEKIYLDYKEQDGLQMPTKILILQDGKKYVEAEVTEIQLLESLDASIFAKP
jgi:outer membrane lipoprotein-sorting protein